MPTFTFPKVCNFPQMIYAAALVGLSCSGSSAFAQSLRDYDKLDLEMRVTSFRSGSHDDSGTSSYLLRVTQFALLNNKEEKLKKIEERKKSPAGEQQFFAITLPSLSIWKASEEELAPIEAGAPVPFNAAVIAGNSVRVATAKMMQEEKTTEENVAHMVVIELMKRTKKYYVLNEDAPLTQVSFFPIPPSQFDSPERVNQTLNITDERGTSVKINVAYKEPLQSNKSTSQADKAGDGGSGNAH
jgi:hypothetical protein